MQQPSIRIRRFNHFTRYWAIASTSSMLIIFISCHTLTFLLRSWKVYLTTCLRNLISFAKVYLTTCLRNLISFAWTRLVWGFVKIQSSDPQRVWGGPPRWRTSGVFLSYSLILETWFLPVILVNDRFLTYLWKLRFIIHLVTAVFTCPF